MLALAFNSVAFGSNTHGNQTVKLSELSGKGSLNLSSKTTYLVDPSDQLQVENILSKAHSMQVIDTNVINYGFVNESYFFSTYLDNDVNYAP